MIAYAGAHFSTEETYMRRFAFPGYSNHKKEHDSFTRKALDLKARAERDEFILTFEVLQFLKDWLSNHIVGSDAGYSAHFNERGLT